MRGSQGLCLGFGGVRVDRAVSAQLLAAVAPHAVEAALEATTQARKLDEEVRRAFSRELEEAEYEAKLASRRHEAVDPDKRLVARELEARWESALERAGRFAPFCARAILVNGPLRRRQEAIMQTDFYGIGLLVARGDNVEVVVPPRPFVRKRFTAAGWQFLEEINQQLN